MGDATRAVPYLLSRWAILSGLQFPGLIKVEAERTDPKGELQIIINPQ